MSETTNRYNVGGIWLPQPFKVRRLGHVGLTVTDIDASLSFYRDLIGLKITDWYPFHLRFPEQITRPEFQDAKTVFMRYAGDHHSVVLLNRPAHALLEPDPSRRYEGGITVQQISWQVGSLKEVVRADEWFADSGVETQRAGRDMPGSNWHTYFYDINGYINELYYGMEQIGWNGHSKPSAMHDRLFDTRPELPQISEYAEVNQALNRQVDLVSGFRDEEPSETYDVDGVLLARPFKVVSVGPIALYVPDVEQTAQFYQERLGFRLADEVRWQGETGIFLRTNTEYFSLGVFPLAWRERLGRPTHTTTAALGLQVANYAQLKAARQFFIDKHVPLVQWPAELIPGIPYAFSVLDPDGHAILFYYRMNQVGSVGSARPATTNEEWPEVIEDDNAYFGFPFLGPLG